MRYEWDLLRCHKERFHLQPYNLARLDRLVTSKRNSQAIYSIFHVIAQIEVLVYSLKEETLFAVTQLLMIGFIGKVYPVVFLRKLLICIEVCIMYSQRLCLAMRLNRIRLPGTACLFRHNRNRSPGSDNVFNKERCFAHHWSPACLIPPD